MTIQEAGVGAVFSGMGIAAQSIAAVVPAVPSSFSSWPVTAILGLLMLACLGIVYMQVKEQSKTSIAASKAAEEAAKSVTQIAEKHQETNRALNEVAEKMGRTNELLQSTCAELKARPCMGSR